jgi:hypothetical protein
MRINRILKFAGAATSFLLYCQISLAQILHPVHWSYAAKKISKTEAVIFIKATIDEGWHIYSVKQKDGGPKKTSFSFTPSKFFTLIDSVSEPTPITKYEKVFSMDVHYFEKAVIFRQKIRMKTDQAKVRGKIDFMTCNDEKCLPPDEVEFQIPIK